MQIKKFTADTHWAAMQQVKQEWGNSALILNTRSVPAAKTWGSKRRNPRVEITAAFDEPRESAKPSPGIEDADSPLRETMLLKQDAVDPDFKAMVCTLLSQTDKARSLGLEGHQLALYRKLVDSGIHEKLAAKIFEKTQAGGIAGGSEPPSVQQQRLSKLMKRAVVCKGAIQPIADRPKITALVGPTGVGKTTTLAKLAANYAIQQRNNVAMITLDTYRVGAVDQLKVYGDLMQVPVETASGREDFRNLLKKHYDKDYIFVDTTGRSHSDHAYAGRLKKIFKECGHVETHLVLSVNLQEKIFNQAFNQFSPLKLDRVLFTKLDEGISFGQMFNFSLRTRLPFSYFTTGQRVPEDLEVAAEEKVIRLIFN